MKAKTWVLVANSAEAKFFHAETVGHLVEVHMMEHPESRLHDRELGEDKPGRTNPSTYRAHSSMEPHNTPKRLEAETFAKDINSYLDHARQQGHFTRLYIAAAPAFLGLLRLAFSHGTAGLIAGEVDKDLLHMNTKELPAALPFAI